MFALQDHLPLDRIITRFSAPTTITQFQRSSLDGILIELARLVTHGANDNIFCLSGLIESGGGGREGSADALRQAVKKGQGGFGSFQYALFRVPLLLFNSTPPCSAAIRAMEISGAAYLSLTDVPLYYTLRASLPLSAPCKLRAVHAWCMVGGVKRVSINTSREQTSTSHSSTCATRMINDAAPVMKGGQTVEGSYRAAGWQGFSGYEQFEPQFIDTKWHSPLRSCRGLIIERKWSILVQILCTSVAEPKSFSSTLHWGLQNVLLC